MKKINLKIVFYVVTFGLIGFLHIFLRMQCLDEDYKLTAVRKKVEKSNLLNKELKASKAKLLSVKNLRSYAKRYKLDNPRREQIIVIQD